LIDIKNEGIYQEFQLKLHLTGEIITKAQQLHALLIQNNTLRAESPYLLVSICILIISRMENSSITFRRISEISHIKEDTLLKFSDMVLNQIETILRKI
jgi:transcription initiation factor TFIIIB Brf1 subunit/transcription initiation factor TFIIB